MEEIVAKSVRKVYIIIYSIALFLSFTVISFGIAMMLTIEDGDIFLVGWIFIGAGLFLVSFFACWLIYFCKMPKNVIIFKDGTLYFANSVTCLPTEIDYFKAKSMWLDGSIFDFGKLIISINGKEFKFKFIYQPKSVINRLYMLKAEYSVKEHIAKQYQIDAEQPVQTENKQEENNG